MIIKTHNDQHLGDNLIHLNFAARAVLLGQGLEWIHYCHPDHLVECRRFVSDIDSIKVEPLVESRHDSVDCWIGSNDFFWLSQKRLDWTSFHLEWFDRLSSKLGITNPIVEADQLYVNLAAPAFLIDSVQSFDVLVNNTTPLSGQVKNFNPHFLNWVSDKLLNSGLSVITTNPGSNAPNTREFGFSANEIGWLSTKARFIIGIPNGPIWPTFNTVNRNTVKARIFLLYGQVITLHNTFCYQREEDFIEQINKLLLSSEI